jgi:hypothetical protein
MQSGTVTPASYCHSDTDAKGKHMFDHQAVLRYLAQRQLFKAGSRGRHELPAIAATGTDPSEGRPGGTGTDEFLDRPATVDLALMWTVSSQTYRPGM